MFIHRRRLATPVVVASHNEMRISYFIPGIVLQYYKPMTYTHLANGFVLTPPWPLIPTSVENEP